MTSPTEHQLLDTGLAARASVIVRFLDAEGVADGRKAWAAVPAGATGPS